MSSRPAPTRGLTRRENQTTEATQGRRSDSRIAGRGDEILSFFEEVLRCENRAPTLREIGQVVGLASTQSVHADVTRLCRQGWLVARKTGSGGTVYTLPGPAGEYGVRHVA
jgi:SOS-response transcriptional repressor LexA